MNAMMQEPFDSSTAEIESMITDTLYVTDSEGSWTRFLSALGDSQGIRCIGEKENLTLEIRPHVRLVFGGDALDRGPYARRIMRVLVQAQKQYPSQVVILAGNRDINKLRLWRELQGWPLKIAPEHLREAPRIELLKWIFYHTMNAPYAVDYRREELIREREIEMVSDDEVAMSFIEDLQPGGLLRTYLQGAQLNFLWKETLFVHGGITAEALGYVPEHPWISDVSDWLKMLNTFYRHHIGSFCHEDSLQHGLPSWWPLILYQAPRSKGAAHPQSVVYGRNADEDNNPRCPPFLVRESLRSIGIKRLIVGHTPNGDIPSLVRGPLDEPVFEMLAADTSRGRHDRCCVVKIDDRGVFLEGDGIDDAGASFFVQGYLLSRDQDPLIGQWDENGYLYKSPVKNQKHLFRYDGAYQFRQIVK